MSRPPACASATAGSSSARLMTFKKFLFIPLLRRLRIQPSHLFELSRRDLRQMSNEMDELPIVVRIVPFTPRRHPGQPDAISNDVEQFSVAKILRLRKTHVGNPRVKVRSHLGLAAAVVSVARGTMIGEVRAAIAERSSIQRNGIAQFPRCQRNRKMTDASRDQRLRRCRLRSRADAAADRE